MYLKLDCNNKIYSIFAHNLLIKGCEIPAWHADGYCDDINNNEACTFDGGDCCGPNTNTQYCTDCSCLDPNGGNGGNSTTTAASTTGGTT